MSQKDNVPINFPPAYKALLALVAIILVVLLPIMLIQSFIPEKLEDGEKIDISSDAFHKNGPNTKSESKQIGKLRISGKKGSDQISVGQGKIYYKVTLDGLVDKEFQRPALKTAVVIDVSGSMSGEKLKSVKAALIDNAGTFNKSDQISVITFSNEAKVVYESGQAGFDKTQYIKAVSAIESEASTDLQSGFDKGLLYLTESLKEVVPQDERYRNMIILSDGMANSGRTDAEYYRNPYADGNSGFTKGIVANVDRVSTIGVGIDYDDSLMSEIAIAWKGNYYFMETTSQSEEIFAKEFGNAVNVVAKNIEVEFQGDNGFELVDIIGYDHVDGRFKPSDVSAEGKSEFVLVLESKSEIPESQIGETLDIGELNFEFQDPKSSDGGLRGTLTIDVEYTEDEDVALLGDDDVYESYVETYIASQQWDAYQALDSVENRKAERIIRDAIEFLKQANKRSDNKYDDLILTLEERLDYLSNLDDEYNIKNDRVGNIIQKSNQQEAYDGNYSR